MPQSLVKNFIHITFSTKHRLPMIHHSIKDELFRYLGGTCKDLESQPIIVGGTNDHVHLLVNLSRKMALMDLIEKLSFKDEYRRFLEKYQIEYDERYVWD